MPAKNDIRQTRKGKQEYSLYDLNAGRVRKRWKLDSKIDVAEGVRAAAAPEDYLISKHEALNYYPYVEHPDLPDPSLVLAIHYYMSKKLREMGRDDVFAVYDETAILAMAIEVEEKMTDMLGGDGHLAYARIKQPGI